MKTYRKLFRGVTYYIFGILLLFGALALFSRNFVGLIVVTAALLIWVLGYNYLKSQKNYAFLVSFFMVNLFWLPLLYRTYERVVFINENGGFERADGYGSPLAFLIGMTFEQIFFIPLTLLFISGVVVILSKGKNK